MKMPLRIKLVKIYNNKKLLNLFNSNEEEKFHKINMKPTKLKLDLIKNNNILKKNFSPKTRRLYENKNINNNNNFFSSIYSYDEKEFIPRLIYYNNNLKINNILSTRNKPKMLKKNFFIKNYIKNNSFNSLNFNNCTNIKSITNLKFPIINRSISINKNKNNFKRRNILKGRGAYKSCNDLSYELFSNYIKENTMNNSKEKENKKTDNFIFSYIHVKNESNLMKKTIGKTNIVNNIFNDIKDIMKNSYIKYFDNNII